MKRAFAVAAVLMSLTTNAAESYETRSFSFEGVPLGSKLEDVPLRFRRDCGSGGNPKYLFCDSVSEAGGVRLVATLSFVDEELAEVQVYFPSEKFDLLWSALRSRYGDEDSRRDGKLEWYSNPMRIELPVPDELVLFRRADEQPIPDGSRFLRGVTYGLLEYRSLELSRREMQRRHLDREEKVQRLREHL